MSQRFPGSHAPPELTLRGMMLGALITVVFTASNVYLGLKVGMTFASSIPAAVISMAVLRTWRGANILENNMVQTQASAAGALAAIIFILPGLLMVGFWSGFPFWQTAAICAIGGILGVLYTIPLRHVMVVQSTLPYPEGMAAAEILKVGSGTANEAEDAESGGDRHQAPGLRDIVIGSVAAALFGLFSGGFRLLAESISVWLTAGRAAFQLTTGFSLALTGVGYLVGIVGGIAILVGVIIAWGVAVPWLTLITPPADGQSLSALAIQVWSDNVRFIGAGTIGIAAIWTLATLFKPMVQGIWTSLTMPRNGAGAGMARTEHDMPGVWIIALVAVLMIALVAVFANLLGNAAPDMAAAPFWALVIGCVLFAFLFGFLIAAACGYMAGLVGSSSSPISGIGILAVILVSLLVLAVSSSGMSAMGDKLAIALTLFTTSVVVATASISNDNLQDLKTGYLLGATPWRQQVALIIGCAVGAVVIPPVLELLYNAYGFAGALPRADMDPRQALGAPQAMLMTALARGIFAHDLNWSMIAIGLALGAVLIAIDEWLRHRGSRARLPVLAVGLGIYLPPSIEMPIVIGAVLGWLISKRLARQAEARGETFTSFAKRPLRRGVLLASGLIVGESLMGVLMAAIIGVTGSDAPLALVGDGFADIARWLGLIVFIAACFGFYRYTLGRH